MTCLKGTLFMVHNSQPAQSLDSRDQVGQTSFWNGLQGHPHPNKQQYNLSLTSLKLRHTWETHTSVPLKLMETHGGRERSADCLSSCYTTQAISLSMLTHSLSLRLFLYQHNRWWPHLFMLFSLSMCKTGDPAVMVTLAACMLLNGHPI